MAIDPGLNRMSYAPQFQLQMFDIVCSTSWANRDKCCELPALVSLSRHSDVSALPHCVRTYVHESRVNKLTLLRPFVVCVPIVVQRKEADCPAMPKACTCTQDSKGPAGPAGPPVSTTCSFRPVSAVSTCALSANTVNVRLCLFLTGKPGNQRSPRRPWRTGPRGEFAYTTRVSYSDQPVACTCSSPDVLGP